MKIHVLVNPRNPTSLKNRMDPFAVHGWKYINQLSKKYGMVHYGIEGADVDCEHVDVPPLDEGNDSIAFNRAAGEAIKQRSEPGDIISCFFGVDNRLACDMNPECKVVEPSIGYRSSGVFAPFRIFTSYANMHYFYGERGMLMEPSWYDAVIGNPFTLSEFKCEYYKDDYYLYFGRVCESKGVHLAIQATEKLGKKLIIAGPGTLQEMGYPSVPSHVECVGYVGPEERKKLMSKAKALFGLTYYLEPFGNMIIEAALSGTPVITTDWGAFPEIVKEGETGYRCKNFSDILNAMKNIEEDRIASIDCRAHGEQFSDEKIHEKHHQYIQRLISGKFYE
jgi:glycosyltransferase involved in cell wall biosynthesis